MKSPMVMSATYIEEADKANYTDMQVLQSAAGYYVGTLYWDSELEFWDQGSRDTGYFATSEEAQAYLDMLVKTVNPQQHVRMNP